MASMRDTSHRPAWDFIHKKVDDCLMEIVESDQVKDVKRKEIALTVAALLVVKVAAIFAAISNDEGELLDFLQQTNSKMRESACNSFVKHRSTNS